MTVTQKHSFTVYKDARGRHRWTMISSSAFKDRDDEIVSTKALADDVERADLDHDYGPLRWWHVPGLDIGDCDFNMMQGRMLIESGTFRDERIGEILKEAPGEYEVSIGFKHPVTEPDAQGVFHHIRRFERSILPHGRASNPLTYFSVKGVDSMATLEEKTKALRELLGDEELVNRLLDQASSREKTAEASGLAFKAKKEEPAPVATVKDDAADDAQDDDEGDEITDDEFNALMAELDTTHAEVEKEAQAAATKAKGKKLAPPPPDEEEDGEDAGEEDTESDEEDTTEEEAEGEAESKVPPSFLKHQKKAKEAPEPEIAPFLGDLPTGQFAELMADALAGALEPYFAQLNEIGTTIKELQEMTVTTKEGQAAKQAETQKAIQTTADEVARLKEAAAKQARALVETQKQIKELTGEMTSAAKGYIASQAEDTVVKEGSPLLQQVPTADPLADFTKFVIGQS